MIKKIIAKEVVEVRNRMDLLNWCDEHNISINHFNNPVRIIEGSKNLAGLFRECWHFNQPVEIPDSARTCVDMFAECKSFNQPIVIPSGVKNCNGMFYGCKSFDQKVCIPKNCSSDYMLDGTLTKEVAYY